MNWFTSTWNGLRNPRRKPSRAASAIPVPRVRLNKTNSKLPRFSANATASDADSLQPNSPDTVRLNQAFTPAQPISDLRRFAGRTELVEQLIRTIEDRRMHVVVHGDRGFGKTSLLHVLAILALEARYLVRYASCSEESEFDDVFRSIAADIRLLYHREYDPTSPEAEQGRSLADLFSDRHLTPPSLSESLAKLAGTRVLLILDEFDRAPAPFRKSVAELIKNLSDRSARVQIVIGGVASNLTELIEHIPSIRRNLLGIPVGPMSDEEVDQIIANAQDIARVFFEPAAREMLLAASNGSPHLANLIGQQSGRTTFNRGSSVVSPDDVGSAIRQVEMELRGRLSEVSLHQLAIVEGALAADVLHPIAGHAQRNFGSVTSDQRAILANALGKGSEAAWWDENGAFRFCDDSIPAILWLATAKRA